MATLSHHSICQKHIIHTTKYYLKRVHALWRKPLHSEHTKIIWQYLIGYLFLCVLNVAAFYFSLDCIKKRFSLSPYWGSMKIICEFLLRPSKKRHSRYLSLERIFYPTAKSVSYMSIRRCSNMITKLTSQKKKKGEKQMKINSEFKNQSRKSKTKTKKEKEVTIWKIQTITTMKISRCS